MEMAGDGVGNALACATVYALVRRSLFDTLSYAGRRLPLDGNLLVLLMRPLTEQRP